jgi:hypothetical protein
MFSYKKIDLLRLQLQELENSIYYNNEILIIKSPIINYEFKDEKLMLKINADSDSHITFMNLCSYIERLFKNSKINVEIIKNRNDIENRCVIIFINEKSKYYDADKEEIFKSNIKSSGKIICSFSANNGKLILIQLLQLQLQLQQQIK